MSCRARSCLQGFIGEVLTSFSTFSTLLSHIYCTVFKHPWMYMAVPCKSSCLSSLSCFLDFFHWRCIEHSSVGYKVNKSWANECNHSTLQLLWRIIKWEALKFWTEMINFWSYSMLKTCSIPKAFSFLKILLRPPTRVQLKAPRVRR